MPGRLNTINNSNIYSGYESDMRLKWSFLDDEEKKVFEANHPEIEDWYDPYPKGKPHKLINE